MELVVRVTTAEAAVAAIQNGADGILLAPAIPPEALGGIFPYARARGIETSLDYSRACGDAETDRAAAHLRRLYELGLDTVLAGEPGMLRLVNSSAPEIKPVWSAPCHNADDLLFAKSQGCSRAVISPFMPSHAVQMLAAAPAVPLAMWLLTPLCPGGDANLCLLDKDHGQPACSLTCRKTLYGYSGAADRALLKTRDLCLLGHLRELPSGVTGLIAPPDPSPEAAGLFTRLARSAADKGFHDERAMREAFASLGLEAPTDAPYMSVGSVYVRENTLGERNDRFWENERRESAERTERACVPVRFMAMVNPGEPVKLAVDDYKGHTLYVEGALPQTGADNPMTEEELCGLWAGTQGIYETREVRAKLSPGLRLPSAEAARLQKDVLEKLTEARLSLPERKQGSYMRGTHLLPRADKPCLTVRVSKLAQVTPELLKLPPERLYVPLDEASDDLEKARWLAGSETVPVAVLPRVTTEGDRAEIYARLKCLHDLGWREALTWNPGQAVMAVRQGYTPRADWSAASTQTLKLAKSIGVISSALAPWLTLADIAGLNHITDTEMIVYGRLPLLLARQCLIKGKSDICACDNVNDLSDGNGNLMPMVRESGHCTMLYHAQKLWMEPVRKQWRHIGLWAARLDFTTENARECVQVANTFAGRDHFIPHAVTTGFYHPAEQKKGHIWKR